MLARIWIALVAIGPACGSESARGSEGEPAPAVLRVTRTRIDPRVADHFEIDARGRWLHLRFVPPGQEVLVVQEARRPSLAEVPERLEREGFFDWEPRDLVPPPELDVDGPFYRVELRSGGRVRVLSTRDPHVPAALLSAVERLEAAAEELEPVADARVFFPRPRRAALPTDPPEIRPSPAWSERLERALIGPFPCAATGPPAPDEPREERFVVRLGEQASIVTRLEWKHREKR